MGEKVEKDLYVEEVEVVDIDGAILPTVEDELLGMTSYTAYIPLSSHIKKLIEKSDKPFKLRVSLDSPKKLSEGETEKMKAAFYERLSSYEGELEMKKRLRWKGLKVASIIESGFLAGNYYSSTATGYDFSVGIARFIGEFIFWGAMIFIPGVIGPFVGGLRYLKRQKDIENLEKNMKEIEFSVRTGDESTGNVMIDNVMKKYSKIDDVKIYEKMSSYAGKAGYKLAHGFYKKLAEALAVEESFITRYLPAGFADNTKSIFDIRVETPDFYAPVGEVEE